MLTRRNPKATAAPAALYSHSVEIPPELYRWAEAFILTHYEAIKKKKRKLNNWKQPMQGSPVTTSGKT